MSYSSTDILKLISAKNSISLNGADGFQQILFGTGFVPLSSTTPATITFSKAFNSVPIVVATGQANDNNEQMRFVCVKNISNTSFDAYGMYFDFSNSAPIYGSVGFYWIAIG